ncbi:hypothetical protein [Desulfovibrio sp. ZJ369]|uniref:hypothetical protein n=1 Tax=Desulfovibrio sp. ZJ369 TaxID=2709793 RepID=UPI0013EA26E4|nr:hypothetical protein [Desulfovibrio sp. ZJ369]
MSVSGISNYNNMIFQWQNQQLKNTSAGSAKSSSASGLSSLFGKNASMSSQLSSMVELTRYAMDAMGLSSDSRVTFSQISKYREQLKNEFTQGVKDGLARTGVKDPGALTFTLNKDGSITANSDNASDKKTVQAWLDANPSLGKDLRKNLADAGIDANARIEMRIGASGKLSVVNATNDTMQKVLDGDAELSEDVRKALNTMGVDLSAGIAFAFDAGGNLVVSGEHEKAEAINQWLSENPDLADAVKEQLEKRDVDASAVSLKLGAEGTVRITVNNSDLKDIQNVLDKENDLGKKIQTGMDSLGIDPNTDFSLQINPDGSVSIISDSADRDKIQQFFDENPALVKKFLQIDVLSGIEDARKAMQIAPNEMRKRIQIESMAAWWAGSNDASSYFGMYSNGNLSMLSGLNLNV